MSERQGWRECMECHDTFANQQRFQRHYDRLHRVFVLENLPSRAQNNEISQITNLSFEIIKTVFLPNGRTTAYIRINCNVDDFLMDIAGKVVRKMRVRCREIHPSLLGSKFRNSSSKHDNRGWMSSSEAQKLKSSLVSRGENDTTENRQVKIALVHQGTCTCRREQKTNRVTVGENVNSRDGGNNRIKQSNVSLYVMEETTKLYNDVTLPYISSLPVSDIQWKTDGKQLIFEDPNPNLGFMLIADMHWDPSEADAMNLHCIAICNRRDVRSIRDLKEEHLPLLHCIRKKSMQAIETRFKVFSSSILAVVDYIPSYFHFHVRFLHVNRVAIPKPGKSHILGNVIENITMNSCYYQQIALSCIIESDHPLYQLWMKQPATAMHDEKDEKRTIMEKSQHKADDRGAAVMSAAPSDDREATLNDTLLKKNLSSASTSQSSVARTLSFENPYGVRRFTYLHNE